ncbi:hypothetical protein A2331_02580 [Candidatus Falkowbacteria bacterium RIFOXYB2_FULL_34_18]|uniref:Radical SAM core domain-containing protein n=1 Tax=Candidatus Falkowbacteria bacterium RIFOXYD2_FULL_34_120 TaxID=1798007 RepID=A0A1F5TRP8_9BACT|nr:MAG: hypothetical protein A2331_02580 [Candidatus Falkowbacteria bacterium RIFOXYB2_FULL_34_18]OGF29626.1 MAG: hypothetical protein A2500_00610 [Candidatus Falkowbacteria bacterium RIFOXYC12_FULL_34_55]OGF37353.1 MAG: hypothetical protein A2466_01380 [Candidatus Falkowbacteria bacterium RIFOXYC2_FULL_34_220]OGF39091.1 MAG: hypothetical protein A2515_00030 [Candidatus Falkowbacteria bacterium RIFOXYD12_FULL_34_57]OGF41615.1 MAG: hypothetical protein A2531_06265 [Candidatus Falkowbacteria bact
MENRKYKIAIINVKNNKHNMAMNKDLNGGFGTMDSYSETFFEKIISFYKKKSIKLPIISLAYLMGIFKEINVDAEYYEISDPLIRDDFDVILIYGSIVDFRNEKEIAESLKKLYPGAKVGFIGPFPSVMPELFDSLDFVIKGSFEKFFLHDFVSPAQLKGIVNIKESINMNDLPHPELDGFPISEYGYSPAITAKPFFALQASVGCPFSCSYYCVYGAFQGQKVITRSPKKVVGDIEYLVDKYNIKGIQFRDPVFGIEKGYIEEFCRELQKNKINIKWGIETRIDLLDKEKIKMMFSTGLRNINIGIETVDREIAKKNKRILININKQEEIIKYCKKIGIKISAFYLFGYEDDTRETMKQTLEYAKKLNTFLARFAICTPYPGTDFYEDLKKEDRLMTYDFEAYTQFNPVIKHKNLANSEIKRMLSQAFKEYYFRLSYILTMIIWKIREFWL